MNIKDFFMKSLPVTDTKIDLEDVETEKDENISEETLDKSEMSATVGEHEDVTEEVTVDPFEEYLTSLSSTREKSEAKHAKENGWDYKRFLDGKGFSAETWNAREPLIKVAKRQAEKIDRLETLIKSSLLKQAKYAKDQSEKNINSLQEELQQARVDKDWDAAEDAYTRLTAIREVHDLAEKEIEEIDGTDDYQEKLVTAAKDFITRNQDWYLSDQDKAAKAYQIEQRILKEDPEIDPNELYFKIEKELITKPVKEPAKAQKVVRKPTIEASKPVRSGDSNSRTKGADVELERLLQEMQGELGAAAAFFNVDELRKL